MDVKLVHDWLSSLGMAVFDKSQLLSLLIEGEYEKWLEGVASSILDGEKEEGRWFDEDLLDHIDL